MWNPFAAKPIAPPTVLSDKVTPLHSQDASDIYLSFVLRFLLRFDDVLDTDKLRSSFERLLKRDGWSKLGARLRRNAEGKLVYHVPAVYDKERPAFLFSTVKHDMSIAEHELGSKLPTTISAPKQAAVVTDTSQFLPLMDGPGYPTKWQDYLYHDMPQIGVYIVSFNDATLVTLSWPHTLLDALGRRALLDAWILVLEGHEDKVPPLHGVDEDPFANLGLSEDPAVKQIPYKLGSNLLSTWQMIVFGLRHLFDTWYHPQEECRMVCMPASVLANIRKQAEQDLTNHTSTLNNTTTSTTTSSPNTATTKSTPFLSDGDLLSAWWTRHATLHLQHNPTQTISLTNMFGLRNLLSPSLFPPPGVYINNAISTVTALISINDLHTKPLSTTAQAVRESITNLGTRDQIEAYTRLSRDLAASGAFPLFGDAGMQLVMFSNWSKARFYDLDFSAAILPATTITSSNGSGSGSSKLGKGIKEDKKGRPSCILPYVHVSKYSMRNTSIIIGKDSHGNYWLSGFLRKGLWDGIAAQLERA